MSGGRDRPWWPMARQAATDYLIDKAAVEVELTADELAGAARRATVGAAQDRSLDIMRRGKPINMRWYEPQPWRKLPYRAPHFSATPTGRIITGVPSSTETYARAARGLRVAAPALRGAAAVTRGIGRVLGASVRGVPVVGVAVEMLHSSPLANGTRAAVGREMLRRYRAGQDPFRFKGAGRMPSRLGQRRAMTFMQVGLNPLRPGLSPEGKPYAYAEDLKPNEPIGNRHVVFPAEYVHRSPEFVPARTPQYAPPTSRFRPWTAAPPAYEPYTAAPGAFSQFDTGFRR